jgi:hypothetical protein
MKVIPVLFLSLASIEPFAHAFAPPLSRSKSRAFVPNKMVSSELKDSIKTSSKNPVGFCIPLQDISLGDIPKVGGKTASLGEMIRELAPLGVDVPGGFGVTSAAYDAVLDR